ncbi:MAG: tetratricopeptide repeat protein [Treponema sp.]|nr:tetratricopeptide repeat protein [Treponema sp.]
MKKNAIIKTAAATILCAMLFSCGNANSAKIKQDRQFQKELETLLQASNASDENLRYAIINKISAKWLADQKYDDLILYLTDHVERNPNDKYNAYWLLMTAYAYVQLRQERVAEYYFERIIKNYPDLKVKDQSVHFLCLERLIQISTNHENRIQYFNTLINRFPSNVSITEMYVRLAREYEQIGEWTRALKTYTLFLEQPDASSIQITDMHDIYNYARNLIDFNNSPKNWTFKTLEGLTNAVKEAIVRYQPRKLDEYRSKVNFFTVSWRQDDSIPTGSVDFSMRNYMHGNRITITEELIPGPTINEAYLKSKGWTLAVPTWYFYFRKVNYPANPDIHGTWEWAGIYIGEMM